MFHFIPCTVYVTVSRIERGQIPHVSADIVVRLAEALDVSLDYLVGRKDEEKVRRETLAMMG
jgi:transcriptional regulator with XRE-family HTH domain